MVVRLLGHLKEHETETTMRSSSEDPAAHITENSHSLLRRITCPDTENSQQRRTHTATMTLVYLTRCKLGKEKLAEHDGIQILVPMVNGHGFTSESKAQTLQLLWNAVYNHKELMVENGIIEVVMQYVKDPKSQPKGIKCAFFLMSHLAHKYPDRVNESGIVQEALTQMSEFRTPISPTGAQTLEGICRLIWSLTLTETTRRSLSTPETVQALLCALNVDREDLDCSEMCALQQDARSADTQHLGAPHDAHKMRAAAALDQLAADPNLSEASSALDAQLLKWETTESAEVKTSLWLGVQPHINQVIRKRPQLLNLLEEELRSGSAHKRLC